MKLVDFSWIVSAGFLMAAPCGAQSVGRAAPDQQVTDAQSRVRNNGRGVEILQRDHIVQLDEAGVAVLPARGPAWRWRLVYIGTNSAGSLEDLCLDEADPEIEDTDLVVYQRGRIEEQYVIKSGMIQQQFVISERLDLHGEDLVLIGTVSCAGEFEAKNAGWTWTDGAGSVYLGRVSVFDATGRVLPATMEVVGDGTRIAVGGPALSQARYPVTIDPLIGTNFQISDMGPDGDPYYKGSYPAVAHSSAADEYLVVWHGEDGVSDLEIFAQRIDSSTGMEIGPNDYRISDMGTYGSSSSGLAKRPAVTYNTTADEYLAVWSGWEEISPMISDGNEIYGQRLDGSSGVEVGPDDFRISDMGPDGVDSFFASDMDVVYNPIADEYLVVWSGTDFPSVLTSPETEIYGQRLDGSTGVEVGLNDFRISDMGPDGTAVYSAQYPAVAYNPTANEYLVVWQGSDDTGTLIAAEVEIFGQRLDGSTGADVGPNDFRISDMGPDGVPDSDFIAYYPDVAYNTTRDEYLVVWRGGDDTPPLVEGEFEVFGQRLEGSTGAEVGMNDFRISDMGPDGDDEYGVRDPAVAYNAFADEYLVVWRGNELWDSINNSQTEIFGQRLDGSTCSEIGPNDFRISKTGRDGDPYFHPQWPALAHRHGTSEYLPVWTGEDSLIGLENHHEIFGQRVTVGLCLFGPLPGIAGTLNTIAVANATPGGLVAVGLGFSEGSTPFGSVCPGLDMGLDNPLVIGIENTGGDGNVRFQQWVRPALSGTTVFLQALDVSACEVTSLIAHTFP